MRRTRFDQWPCPIARTTDLVGDWWTPLVMREAFSGRRRFEDFQRALKVPRAVLARRLDRLVDEGLLKKVSYEDRPPRYEYRLTDKARHSGTCSPRCGDGAVTGSGAKTARR